MMAMDFSDDDDSFHSDGDKEESKEEVHYPKKDIKAKNKQVARGKTVNELDLGFKLIVAKG